MKLMMAEFHLAASVSGPSTAHAGSLSHCHGLLGHLNRRIVKAFSKTCDFSTLV